MHTKYKAKPIHGAFKELASNQGNSNVERKEHRAGGVRTGQD